MRHPAAARAPQLDQHALHHQRITDENRQLLRSTYGASSDELAVLVRWFEGSTRLSPTV
jgi:hypothetical protein